MPPGVCKRNYHLEPVTEEALLPHMKLFPKGAVLPMFSKNQYISPLVKRVCRNSRMIAFSTKISS